MALSASGLYRLSAEQLRIECSERGLSSSGSVRVLRAWLANHLKADEMDRRGARCSSKCCGGHIESWQ